HLLVPANRPGHVGDHQPDVVERLQLHAHRLLSRPCPHGTPARRARPPGVDRMGDMSSLPIPAFAAPRRVLLAAPRGYCAGVERAVDIVEVALATYGPPVYLRKQIV